MVRGALLPALLFALIAAACLDSEGATATRYEVKVQFNTSVTQGDLDDVAALLRGYDQALEYRVQLSFPPTGRATLTTAAPHFCPTTEAELEAKTYVHDVTCQELSEPSQAGSPEQPVSSDD